MNDIYQAPTAELAEKGELSRSEKLYKISGIGVATFFGTALAGGYLLRKNLLLLGEYEKARKVTYIAILLTLSVLGVSLFLPDDVHSPNLLFTIVQIAALVHLSKAWIASQLAAHEQEGGQFYSNWRAFGISLLVLVAMILIFVPIVFVLVAAGIM